MINIIFYKDSDIITGFSVSGHSGFADKGSDIVCAAVSSAVELTVNAITEVIDVNAEIAVNEKNASVLLKLPERISDIKAEKCQTVLKSLQLHLKSLQENYKDNITFISEV